MIEQAQELLKELKLETPDVLIVADGSGTNIHNPSAYSARLFVFGKNEIFYREINGSQNLGSNNFAELIPFLMALYFDYECYASKELTLDRRKAVCVSDSELTVRCATGQYSRNANLSLWAMLDFFARSPYDLVWRHVPRNSNPINADCDRVAGILRKGVTNGPDPKG